MSWLAGLRCMPVLGPIKLPRKLDPKLWVSKAPFGLGRIKPHHIRETMKVIWDNKDNLLMLIGFSPRVCVTDVHLWQGDIVGVSLENTMLPGDHERKTPEIAGPRIEKARAEWQIYSELASRAYPEQSASITSILRRAFAKRSH